MTPLLTLALAAIPVILAVGFVRGAYDKERTSRIPRPYKMATSLLLVGVALFLWLSTANAGAPRQPAATLIFFGMAAGFVGDLIMAQLVPTPNRLIFGILAFSGGHVLYSVAFVRLALALGLPSPLSEWLVIAAFLALAVVLWRLLVYTPRMPATLNGAALGYAALISLMAALAEGLALQDGRFWGAAIGAVLFLLSDILLGNREFRDRPWFLVHDVVWALYIAGQALIVLTTAY